MAIRGNPLNMDPTFVQYCTDNTTYNNHHCYTKECMEKYEVWMGVNVAVNVHIFYAVCLWCFGGNKKTLFGKCFHWRSLYFREYLISKIEYYIHR